MVGPDASSGQRASEQVVVAKLRRFPPLRGRARPPYVDSQRLTATPVSTSANENPVETLGYSFPAISTYGYTK